VGCRLYGLGAGLLVSLVLVVAVSYATQKRDVPKELTDVDGNPLPLTKRLGWLPLKDALGKPKEEELEPELVPGD
jgi:hypothetical protein